MPAIFVNNAQVLTDGLPPQMHVEIVLLLVAGLLLVVAGPVDAAPDSSDATLPKVCWVELNYVLDSPLGWLNECITGHSGE